MTNTTAIVSIDANEIAEILVSSVENDGYEVEDVARAQEVAEKLVEAIRSAQPAEDLAEFVYTYCSKMQ